ncbi:MAG: hypothetical protein LQ340_006522 [Diploschistes diacapsis]|nr:MAG: hypothetical protein LQ340_006522 [Diploschistes diacapsis]
MGSLPSPPVALGDHCSTVYNDTLYAFQWNAFQSLPLREGAQWSQQPMGVAVNGSRCVLGQWDGQDALIIVGGTTTNPANASYPGLQHFNFASKNWTSTPPGASVTQNRQMHGATYLNSTNSILIYSGFQDNSFSNSSETFTVSTQEPYIMQSFPAQSPPGMSPIVLPWNASHGVMVGGSAHNKAVWVFSEATGWQQIEVALQDSVGNMSMVQGSIIQGNDDSKALQLFNMSSTPNQVISLLVQAGNDQPASKEVERGKIIIENGKELKLRQINFGTWPAYNGSQAPSLTRDGFSLAQSSSGVVIVSGGTSNADDSVCMFNQTANSWINANQFFGGKTQSPSGIVTGTATSTFSFPSATSAAAAVTSLPASSSNGLPDTSRVVLGSVLGGLAGMAALFVILLLLLRCCKTRQKKRGEYAEKGKRMGFDDSAAVAGFGRRKGSSSSSTSNGGLFSRNQSPENMVRPQISNPHLLSDSTTTDKDLTNVRKIEAGPPAASPRTEARDAGWSQYFANGNSNTAPNKGSDPEVVLGTTASRQTAYLSSNYHRKSSTASIHPFELDLEQSNTRSSGYPQSEESWEKSKLHPQSMTSTAAYGPGTAISHVSEEVPETFLDPASSSSGTQNWDPVGAGDGKSAYDRRPPSSIYAESISFPHPGDKVYIPGVSDVRAPVKKMYNNSFRQSYNARGMRTMATKDFGVASDSQPPVVNSNAADPSTYGPTLKTEDGRPPVHSDMSWLNLGNQ